MSKIHFVLLSLFLISFTEAQQPAISGQDLKKGLEQKIQITKNALVKNVAFENIGPTIMSGRVTDLAVNPDNPTEFYVGYASGGVWHTVNNGTTFTPILDSANTQNVGDIAVDWKSRTIWVGTGENNASRSSYAGIGLLKSTDNGKTWQNMGLNDSHHIGRILINPNNANEVVVGVTGYLYSPNQERGIYKTMDGGTTWSQKLFVDDVSGIIDLQTNPNNFKIMFASSWTKVRNAWNFEGNGSNSAIYKSTDAGNTWKKVSTENSGFPTGNGIGRIGLAIYDDDIVYAILDNQNHRPKAAEQKASKMLQKEDFKSMTAQALLDLEDKKLNAYLKMNGFQEKYRAENIKQLVRSGNLMPIALATYLEDANSQLFDTPVIGAEVYKSTDGGSHWTKTHDDYLDEIYYSYGYYFGHIYVAPQHPDHIYIYGVPIVKSKDGGKTFTSINAENVHADHHALWINPKNPNHLINGNDGGVNMSYDAGENWIKNNSPSVGQFYAIAVDHAEPYNVYGGLQDNGVWKGAHNAKEDKSWQQSGQYPWQSILGGDGMQVQIDRRNTNVIYTGFQFGNYYRINLATNERAYIQPKHHLGERPYRFNWQTPILLSAHNQDILYLGGNKLMRSMNQGRDWEAISDDLTHGGKQGNVAYGTLTCISESPFQFGLLYTGSDDGLLNLSQDAGATWQDISTGLPKDLWVSRVIASQYKKERVYVTLNGYRWDNFKAYVYKSDNYGSTWQNISSNLPASPINVIREDPENENLLYLGSDNGAYVSFDRGQTWEAFSKGLPNVAVHDIALQAEAKDLLLGTHGRSIYKTNIAPLQKMSSELKSKAITIFTVADVQFSPNWGSNWSKWQQAFEPKLNICFFAAASEEDTTLKIFSENDILLNQLKVKTDKGYNYVDYDLTLSEAGKTALASAQKDVNLEKAKNDKYYLPIGKYRIEIGTAKTTFEIK